MNTFNTNSGETTFTKEQLENWAENAATVTDNSAGTKSPVRVAESNDTPAEKTKKTKKQKQKRGENQPKRPMSGYMLFLNENRAAIKAKLLETSEKVTVGDIAKAGGLQWKALEDTAKAVFTEKSDALKEEYATAMETWRTEHPEEVTAKKTEKKTKAKKETTTLKSTFNPGDSPVAPPGMTGPFEGYLAKTVKTVDGKASFKDFQEAVTAAMELGDACGGLTRTTRGWSLRKAITVATDGPADRKEVSYLKSQFVSEELAGQVVDTNATPETESEPETQPEPVQAEEKPKKKRGRPAKKPKEPTPEPEPVEEPKESTPEPEPVVEPKESTPEPEPVEEAGGKSDAETEEEEELHSDAYVEDTISWVFKGKDYEVDQNNGKVYVEDEDGEFEFVGYRKLREITVTTKTGKSKTKKEFFIDEPWKN